MKKILLLCLLTVSILLSAQITIGEGSTMVGKVPIDNFWEYSYSQQIFTKQEINTNAAGNITGLKFYVDPTVDITDASDWVVYLGHTSKTEFASEDDWIPLSNLTEVYSGTISAVNDVVEVTFAVPFAYNNTQNLVIAVDENNPDYNYSDDRAFYVHHLNNLPKSAISTISMFTDCDPADPQEGELLGYRSVITFLGLTPSPIPSCTGLMYPVNNAVLVPLSPTITWYPSTGATSYKISIGTTPGASNIVNQQSVSTTSFTPSTPLTLNTTYYVKVISVGAGGESSGCSETKFTTTPPPPSNDDCSTAVTLTVNSNLSCAVTTAGTTIAATNSGVDIDPCYGNADDDVWYKFTAAETSHIISLKNITSVGSEFDDSAYFQVFSGDCTGLTSVVCSSYTGQGVASGLTVGQTYYIRVYSYSEGSQFAQSFNICVGTLPPPPSNDDCSTAVTLTVNPGLACGTVTAGHTLGATDSGVGIGSCFGNPDDDVWFKFTATSARHIITLSDVMSLGEFNSTDTYFQVFSGDCTTGLTSIECVDPLSKIINGLTAGTTYYVRVFSYSGTGRALAFNICVTTLPPPPVNDECSGALSASVFPYTYTQADALGTTNNNGIIDICSADAMNDGTWFTFTGDGTVHNIKVTMPTGSSFDPQIGVYSGTCGSLSCVNTVDDNGGGSTEMISVPTVAGTVYYVNVGHYDSISDKAEDVFTITINKETLGTSEVAKAKNEIKVYPNPFADVLNIAKADQVKSVSVMDVSGRLVKTIENPSSVLYLGDLKQGLYVVVLNMKDGTKQTVKAIKK